MNDRVQIIPDNNPNVCFVLRVAAGKFLFGEVNSAFEASTGLARDSIIGRTLQDVLPEALAADFVDRCRHCLSGAPPTPFMRIMPLPAGRTPWELLLTWCFDESGAIVGIYGTAREVSERDEPQDAEAAELEGEADRLPNIRFTAFPDGRLDHADPRLFAMAGLPLDSSAQTAADFVCPEDLARLAPPADCGQTDAAYETDVRLRCPGGGYRWFRVRAELVDGLAGRRWYGVALDIEAKRKRILSVEKSEASNVDALAAFGGCCVVIDRQWRVTRLTSKAAAWIGRTEAQLLGADCREQLPVPKALVKAVRASLAAQTPLQIEMPAPGRPDRWVEFQIHPFAAGARIVFRDVTDRRSAHKKKAPPTAEPSHGVLDASVAEMALLDSDGVIVSVNAAWRETAQENQVGEAIPCVGASYSALCKVIIPGLDESALRAGMGEVLAGRQADYTQPYVIATPGGLWWRQLRIIPFRLAPSAQLIAIHEDITDVGQAWAALRNTSEQLLTALAHERERIAFELHDSTSQHLAALGLGLIRLKRLAGSGAGDLIADMRRSVRETVREIRVLSYLMKPSELKQDDLDAAAQLFVNGFAARTGLNAQFRTRGTFEGIPDMMQNAVFRVLQEALSNVYRHARASSVEVDLTNCDGALSVRIADDGRGIALLSDGQLTVAPGVGFASMQSRVTQLGGTLNISRGVVGAIVEARIPTAGMSTGSDRAAGFIAPIRRWNEA